MVFYNSRNVLRLKKSRRCSLSIKLYYLETEHEKKTEEFFGKNNIVLSDENIPKYNLGVFICFTNRSGSNLVAEYLSLHPELGNAGEPYNYPQIIKISKENNFSNFEEYFRYQIRMNHIGKRYITKASPYQLTFLLRYGIPQRNFKKTKIIYVYRENLLEQAISQFIAFQNEQWASFQVAKQIELKYDRNAIYQTIQGIAQTNKYANVLFNLIDLDTFQIKYEDFIKNREIICEDIFRFLGLSYKESLYTNFQPRHKKQIMPEKDLFYKQFKNDNSVIFNVTDGIHLIPRS